MKWIMHIDINQFFAACAILKEPSLKGKPLIIASDTRRGIVSTSTYEARKYGIYSGMPTYLAKKACKDVIIRSVDFAFYHQKSEEFFTYLKDNVTDVLEQVSIDEAYLDLTDILSFVTDKYGYLQSLQQRIFQVTKLQSSIGLANNKFLAKMGSDYNKPMGITIITKDRIQELLYPLKIKDFWGIGKKTYPKLNEIGIYTIGDLAVNESPSLKKILGKFYDEVKAWIRGEGDDEVNPVQREAKSISSTSTFLYDTSDYEEIRQMILQKSKEISLDAKKDKKVGKTVTLILKDASFKSITRSITLSEPTNDYVVIYDKAMELFDKLFSSQLFRLAGVGLSSLIDEKEKYVQMTLLDAPKENKASTKLLVKQLNHKVKKDILMLASDLKEKKDAS